MWKPEAVFDLIEFNHGYFIAKFESLRDYEFAKYEGPWKILDHYLVVQEWEPNFNTRNNKTTKLLVWVRFPSLQVEYFEEDFLMKIRKDIGHPPLLSRFVLNEKEWPIEYEGIHLVCFNCGTYGHRHEQCGKNENGNDISAAREETRTNTKVDDSGLKQNDPRKYGSWMLVSRSNRRGCPRTSSQANRGVAWGRRPEQPGTREHGFEGVETQSRFAPLQDLDLNEMAQDQDVPDQSLPMQQRTDLLPRIRTNIPNDRTRPEQRSPYVTQRALPQPVAHGQVQQANRGGYRGRGGRGGIPNRAAAEPQHTVVRGSTRGKTISTMVVYHNEGGLNPPITNCLATVFKEAPPDTDRNSTMRTDQINEAMDEDQYLVGQDGQVVPLHLRS
ncbi:uncharacterized protein LOC116015934 [Ipomoea triloba]|uniref:uncharacterized protein LOC116015934 n=1 Tax=Ipomoea triloba TaxID=35885 RepID=UPI00125E89E3|nr:uncharacterized protein LOC116015934 [Ipomoea triloba]